MIKTPRTLFLFLCCFISYHFTSAQILDLTACDTIANLKTKNACIFKVYEQSQTDLTKTYNALLGKLDKKIKISKPNEQIKVNSLKLFLKEAQTQWVLTRDFNAKVHASYELTTLLAENAFYRSKASESINRNAFLKSLSDSLNIK